MRARALSSSALTLFLVANLAAVGGPASAGRARQVLRVGRYHGISGQFRHIQDAVDAAQPGDWILIGKGDYHEQGWGGLAGVYITTPDLHLRGMNRNGVIVDGTLPGSATCSSDVTAQDYGPPDGNGEPQGRNGVWIDQASGATVENLTACNFLSSADGENGDQIWWDGGDGSGHIGLHAWTGRYLSTTTTYYDEHDPHQAQYGIFAVNSDGPGLLDQGYASNMADSGIYIGACPDCNAVLDHLHSQNNAIGYSGTNSGGHLIVQNSEWDHNRSGIVPNSLNNDDQPEPQDGACPNGDPGPYGTGLCTVFRNNDVHDNNNPNTPTNGTSGLVPIGTGFEFPGASNNMIVGNRITKNGGWGVLIHDFPDSETPPPGVNCEGGVGYGEICLFTSYGNQTIGNTLAHNGFFGNQGNVDLGNEASTKIDPGNCFKGNHDPQGLTSDPQDIETVNGNCGGSNSGDVTLAGQVACASGVLDMGYPGFQCPGPANYPQRTTVRLGRLHRQPTMPDPCAGVPANPWCPSPGDGSGAPGGATDGMYLNVLPAGQGKSVNTTEALRFESTGEYPDHFVDQLDMYNSLATNVDGVTDRNLTDYFKQESLGVPPSQVERVETPKPGVTIEWDTFGVPHISGDTRADAMFGTGYAAAEDRLFMMDVLRHVGRGRLSEFAGPTEDNFALDRATYLAAGYSESELQAQVRRLNRYGAVGRQIIRDGRQYIAGINTRIDEDKADPNKLPAEYPALQLTPKAWVPADLVAVAVVIQAEFAGGGGNELLNAVFLQDAKTELGDRRGQALFDDLREREDPEAPTSADTPFPYNHQGAVDPNAVAAPDPNSVTPYDPLTLTPQTQGAPGGSADQSRLNPARAFRAALARIGLDLPNAESNWLAVNADRTKAGHPIAVMGPQVGYFVPQILMDMDVHAPGLDAHGATFPGISLYVLLGRGIDFAWSATSGESDEVDVRAEKLCDPNGGDPSPDSTYYQYNGACVPMTLRTDQWVSKPTPGGPGQPTVVQADVQRTVHGPVIARATVDGAPVAYTSQRSTFGAELDSSVSFEMLNSGDVHDAASFKRTMSYETGSFNWLYVDHQDVAYYHSGLYPVRAAGVDTNLPSWGTGRWEWKGFVSASKHPQAVNPSKGWIDSWNNKPAPAWESSDANYNFGPVHRVQMLSTRLADRVPQGDMTPADMVRIMADAATVDLRGQEVMPAVLGAIGGDPNLQQYLDIMSAWVASGAHRIDRDGDGQYDDQAAVALMDAWWTPLVESAFASTMGQGDLFDQFPMPFDDGNRTAGLGSSFQDGYYGHVQKSVRMAMGQPVAQPYTVLVCGDGTAAGCRAALIDSLNQAVAVLGPDPSTWDANEAGDAIQYQAVGLITLHPQPWQNRPTFQQVVQPFGHR